MSAKSQVHHVCVKLRILPQVQNYVIIETSIKPKGEVKLKSIKSKRRKFSDEEKQRIVQAVEEVES